MSFDPEKAERHTVHDDQVDVLNSHLDVREYVLASDYDQLLSLYRDAVGDLKDREELIIALGSRLTRRYTPEP